MVKHKPPVVEDPGCLEAIGWVRWASSRAFARVNAKGMECCKSNLADRVILMDLTIGRKGLLGYLKALGGSNIIKVIPSTASASGLQANGHKRLKVICGANTSYLANSEWIGDKTPLTLCDVRVSPNNSVKPNIGASELAEALNRVLPLPQKMTIDLYYPASTLWQKRGSSIWLVPMVLGLW